MWVFILVIAVFHMSLQVYQLHADRVMVLAKSDLDVEIRVPLTIPAHLQSITPSPTPPTLSSAKDAASAFSDFRKRKLGATTANTHKKLKKDQDDNKPDKKPEEVPAGASNKGRRSSRKAPVVVDDAMNCE